MIIIDRINKSFGKNKVLDCLSVQIPGNKIVSVLGPNGSGKTTLIKSIMGMVKPDDGEIFLDNQMILGRSDYRRWIDYLPQISRYPDNLTAAELIRMVKDIRQQNECSAYFIKLFNLQPHMNKRLKNLSGGTLQKVNLLLSLMFRNEVLILDEPTNGLDPATIIKLKDHLSGEKVQGKSIIFTTHIISLVEELADEIIFLLDGRIYFQGSPEDLKKKKGESSLERAIAGILTNHDKTIAA